MPRVEQTLDDAGVDFRGPKGLSIRDGFIRRALTLTALKTTARLYKQTSLSAIVVSPWHVVKTSYYTTLTEAVTMEYLAKNISIPVPKVCCSFIFRNRAYLVMERMRGRAIAFEMNDASEHARKALLHQLKGMIDELRALKPSPSQDAGVQSCINGPLRDCRLPRGREQFGPFKTIQDFHFWLRDDYKLTYIEERLNDAEHWRDVKDMAVRQDGDWPPPVFTHGDLNPSNILARDGKVIGIIDWEFAGWYPDYWEYTSVWYGNQLRPAWQEELDQFLKPYPEELEMEITRQKWYGDV